MSLSLFEAFLTANGVESLENRYDSTCFPANPEAGNHPVTKLLYKMISEVDDNPNPSSFRCVIPKMRHYDRSKVVHITYAWVVTYSQRELDLDRDLPQDIPAGFEHLRQQVLSVASQVQDVDKEPEEGRLGFFSIHEEAGSDEYFPQAVMDRYQLPQKCDRCGYSAPSKESVDMRYDFDALMTHRREAHGLEECCPLPDGV